MERARLLAVRLQKGWTREQAAGYLEVDPATIKRWEHGTAKPQPLKLQKLCTIYGKTPQELGLAEEEATEGTQTRRDALEDTTGDAYMAFRTSDLTMRLFRLVWNYPNHTARYHELQHILLLELEDNEMPNEPITRRDALRRLAMLPIEMGSLSAISAVFKLSFEDILTQCAAGVTACWYLRKGKDLAFASEIIAKYLPTLLEIVKTSSQHRKTAADLVVQCLLLKSTLVRHLDGSNEAVFFAQQAESYSKIAESVTLEVLALRTQAAAHYYANHWEQACFTAEKARFLLETSKGVSVATMVHSYVHAGLATYQAHNGKRDDALTSLKKAHKTFFAQSAHDIAPIWVDHNQANLILNDGMAHYHLGLHKEALDSFVQIKTVPMRSESIYVESLINQVIAEIERDDQPRNMELCISQWKQGIQGACILQSEQRYNEAIQVYTAMRAAWPGEKTIKDLREYLTHW